MNKIKDGGPAFPVPEYVYDSHAGLRQVSDAIGMTLRDYFAAKAMAAMIAEPMWHEGTKPVFSRHGNGGGELEGFATASYAMADAMLAAREPSYTTKRSISNEKETESLFREL